MKKTSCRMCKGSNLKKFLDLGFTPLADGFLDIGQLHKPETYYPLNVCLCKDCGLAQLDYVVSPDEMFRKNYPYMSSITKTGKQHFYGMADSICRRFNLGKGNLAIDIGSNVGVLLEGFKKNGLNVLGIDPAENIAKIANENGIETWAEYFNSKIKEKIVKKKGIASVITATNVFAHIDDIDDVVNAVKSILHDKGIFVVEFPYFLDLVDKLEYDTIYHEHLSYISLKPLISYFKNFGMEVFDAEKHKIHGGTLRVFVCKSGFYKKSKGLIELVKLEERIGLNNAEALSSFQTNVNEQKKALVELIVSLKIKGKRIVGIGAPAKGNTLLNFCGIGKEYIDYLTEKSPTKIGLYSPGTHIPIVDDKKVFEDFPDYAMLLAWNFADEIIENLKDFKKKGGKFIIPIPKPRIV